MRRHPGIRDFMMRIGRDGEAALPPREITNLVTLPELTAAYLLDREELPETNWPVLLDLIEKVAHRYRIPFSPCERRQLMQSPRVQQLLLVLIRDFYPRREWAPDVSSEPWSDDVKVGLALAVETLKKDVRFSTDQLALRRLRTHKKLIYHHTSIHTLQKRLQEGRRLSSMGRSKGRPRKE